MRQVQPGSSRDIEFILTNVSSQDARITETDVSCSCLTILKNDGVIPSGGRFALPVRVSTSEDDRGQSSTFINIYFDKQQTILKLRVDVDLASK